MDVNRSNNSFPNHTIACAPGMYQCLTAPIVHLT